MDAVNMPERTTGTHYLDGAKVKALRHMRRWSQAQLARETGRAVTQSTLSDIENSTAYRARLETAAALARVLRVSIDDLVADPVSVEAIIQRQGVGAGQHGGTGWVPIQPATDMGHVPAPATGTLESEGRNMWVESAQLARAGRLAGVKIDDNSCEPHAPAGWTAIVNRDMPWTDGAYHLLDWQGERVLRRVLVAANLVRVVDPRSGEPSAYMDQRKVVLHGVVVVWQLSESKAAL